MKRPRSLTSFTPTKLIHHRHRRPQPTAECPRKAWPRRPPRWRPLPRRRRRHGLRPGLRRAARRCVPRRGAQVAIMTGPERRHTPPSLCVMSHSLQPCGLPRSPTRAPTRVPTRRPTAPAPTRRPTRTPVRGACRRREKYLVWMDGMYTRHIDSLHSAHDRHRLRCRRSFSPASPADPPADVHVIQTSNNATQGGGVPMGDQTFFEIHIIHSIDSHSAWHAH